MNLLDFFHRDRSVLYEFPDLRTEIRLISLVLSLLIMVFACLFWKNCWNSQNDLLHVVDGFSMYPTLLNQQMLYAKSRTNFHRQDIVCLKMPETEEVYEDIEAGDQIVKRIIALPGEHLQIQSGGRVYVDGIYLWEPYLTDNGREHTYREFETHRIMDITLGEQEYFVMGDNREDSLDSRAFGPVTNEELLCTVTTKPTGLMVQLFSLLFFMGALIPFLSFFLIRSILSDMAVAYLRRKEAC